MARSGVVARGELLSVMDGRSINRARASGRLFDLHPDFGVYSIVPPELLSEDARIHAALLAVPASVLAVQSAAWRQRLIPAPPFEVQLLSPHEHRAPPGVAHRRVVFREGDVISDGTFPVTSVPRTLLDLGVNYSPATLARALAEAEFHHATLPADVHAVRRRGHPGSATLRRALDFHVPGFGVMKSRLERRFRALLIEHDVALPERDRRIGPYRVDCLWPHLKLVVELDGGQHERPGQAAVDADRDLYLRGLGFTVLRYSYRQVFDRGAEVVRDLRALM